MRTAALPDAVDRGVGPTGTIRHRFHLRKEELRFAMRRLRINAEAVEAVPGTGMFPVVYDFYRSSAAVPGSVLVLLGCSQKLTEAVREGMSHFFHENNPSLGSRLWRSWDGNFSLSTDGRGHVFYRKLRRASSTASRPCC